MRGKGVKPQKKRISRTTKGIHTGDGDDDDSDNYNPNSLPAAAVAALSDSEPAIPFGFGGQEAVETLVGYTEIKFSIFTQGYLLILLGFSSLSYFTGTGINEDTEALRATILFLG